MLSKLDYRREYLIIEWQLAFRTSGIMYHIVNTYSFVNSVSFIALTSNSCVHVLLGCVCKNQ